MLTLSAYSLLVMEFSMFQPLVVWMVLGIVLKTMSLLLKHAKMLVLLTTLLKNKAFRIHLLMFVLFVTSEMPIKNVLKFAPLPQFLILLRRFASYLLVLLPKLRINQETV